MNLHNYIQTQYIVDCRTILNIDCRPNKSIGRRNKLLQTLHAVFVSRKEETGKAKKEVYGCGERGHGLG